MVNDQLLMPPFRVDWLSYYRAKLYKDWHALKHSVVKPGSFNSCVLKLDKNFHVYVHGKKDLMQVEQDCNGTYLKLYFKQIN